MGSPASAADRWIRHFHPAAGSQVRVVCFPHAGGSASYYFPLSEALSPQFDVRVVQYPGRQDRRAEPPLDNIPDLADGVFRALAELPPRPQAFFGHSMGGVVAFEVARRCQRLGLPAPLRLFVSASPAPASYTGERVQLSDDDALIAELAGMGGTDAEILRDPEVLELVMPVIRSDYHAVETYRYRPGPPLASPVTALVGDADPVTPSAAVTPWSSCSYGDFSLHTFPGGHFYLEDNLPGVVKVITGALSADYS
jgi:pyochelin biosynthesis protein PchC